MKRKFWNWVRNEGERTLFLNGEISDETWYGDEVTPKLFKDELLSGEGDITVWINSPGGDVFAAAQIYNMLMDYKGNVTVKIDGLAASAASVIAMAGTKVLMSPVAMMMIHNPATIAIGDTAEMKKATDVMQSRYGAEMSAALNRRTCSTVASSIFTPNRSRMAFFAAIMHWLTPNFSVQQWFSCAFLLLIYRMFMVPFPISARRLVPFRVLRRFTIAGYPCG